MENWDFSDLPMFLDWGQSNMYKTEKLLPGNQELNQIKQTMT